MTTNQPNKKSNDTTVNIEHKTRPKEVETKDIIKRNVTLDPRESTFIK